MNPDDDFYGEERLLAALAETAGTTTAETVTRVSPTFVGSPPGPSSRTTSRTRGPVCAIVYSLISMGLPVVAVARPDLRLTGDAHLDRPAQRRQHPQLAPSRTDSTRARSFHANSVRIHAPLR